MEDIQAVIEQLKASTKETHPILTLEEAREFYKNNTNIHDVTGNGIVFFTNKKCYGFGLDMLGRNDYSCASMKTYLKVKPRAGLDDGWITNLDTHIRIFFEGYRVIQSIEELATYIVTGE